MKIIMLGPPGSGKGTQAAMLKEQLGVPAISTGAILRSEIAAGTDIGLKADGYISRGELVPDDVIIDIVERRFLQPDCQKGFILDGFPRTTAQAEALDAKGVKIDAVVVLNLDDEVIVKRMSGRRICKKCDASFHVEKNPPKAEGICDFCGGALYTRVDDAPETVRNRLDTYHKNTEPLLDYYKNLLRNVESYGNIDDVLKSILAALGV
ncbi:MAG: adenylate kinase [Oscillospiraceae bacterium]|nr:adenylate kinase [Oscillospiraceae bacterium]